MTPEEQIDDWGRLGLLIPDREDALHFVRHAGAGILREYAVPLLDSIGGKFLAGAEFGHLADIFEFDHKMRMVVLDAALQVEISARAQMEAQGALPAASGRDKKSSFGKLSRRFAELPFAERQIIAAAYGMDAKVLLSFLHHLTIVRNTCAHNDRLWGFEFGIRPMLPEKKPALKAFFNYEAQGRLYNTLIILAYLTDIISPERDWRRGMLALMASREQSAAAMGFPPGWRALQFWV